MTKIDALQKYFGYNTFRPAQETLIDALLASQDVLAVMPTGAGKSICYQIPALLADGITLVISPLISLMKDQVMGLRNAQIPAAFVNSSLSINQYREVMHRVNSGEYKIIYIAPERLETKDFKDFAHKTGISVIAIDEAHCVSQWGRDFRPDYLKIKDFINALHKRPVVGAFTATATEEIKRDIIRLLGLRKPVCITTGFDRANLYFGVEKPANKQKRLYELIDSRTGLCGIVYCSTRRAVDMVSAALKQRGISALRYHAGLDDKERHVNQNLFISGKADVIVATNAFGMGIDKADVRYVIHYNMPKNMESYYQEAGRAGRDGNPSECILLFTEKDIEIAEHLIDTSANENDNGSGADLREKKHARRMDEQRLDKMIRYCEINSCLRSYILAYFGQKYKGKCGYCSNCLKPGIIQRVKKLLTAPHNAQL